MEIGSELLVDYSCMLMTPLLEGGGGLLLDSLTPYQNC